MSTQVSARVAAIIDELFGMPAQALNGDVTLQEGLQLDSLSVVELQAAIEDAFNIRFADRETSDVGTFGELVAAVDSAVRRHRRAS